MQFRVLAHVILQRDINFSSHKRIFVIWSQTEVSVSMVAHPQSSSIFNKTFHYINSYKPSTLGMPHWNQWACRREMFNSCAWRRRGAHPGEPKSKNRLGVWLVVEPPSEKYESVGIIIPNLWENYGKFTNVPNHQPVVSILNHGYDMDCTHFRTPPVMELASGPSKFCFAAET